MTRWIKRSVTAEPHHQQGIWFDLPRGGEAHLIVSRDEEPHTRAIVNIWDSHGFVAHHYTGPKADRFYNLVSQEVRK